MSIQTQYIFDEKGKKMAVVLPIKKYEKMIEELEDKEDIRLYDAVKSSDETSIPMEEAFKLIEAKRKSVK